jgi:NAD(P)H-hydrate epimerase
MVEVDRIMIEDLGIDLTRMMENAGRSLARLVGAMVSAEGRYRVVVLAGRGGNGGGALVAARRLAGWSVPVQVFGTRPASEYNGVSRQQLEILDRMGIVVDASTMPSFDGDPPIVIDGLIGYNLSGPPRDRGLDLINWMNSQEATVVSLDVPSGLDSATGRAPGAVVSAAATMTLALPKWGVVGAEAGPYVGDLYLADIGVPASLYREAFGIDVGGLFDGSDVVRIT